MHLTSHCVELNVALFKSREMAIADLAVEGKVLHVLCDQREVELSIDPLNDSVLGEEAVTDPTVPLVQERRSADYLSTAEDMGLVDGN